MVCVQGFPHTHIYRHHHHFSQRNRQCRTIPICSPIAHALAKHFEMKHNDINEKNAMKWVFGTHLHFWEAYSLVTREKLKNKNNNYERKEQTNNELQWGREREREWAPSTKRNKIFKQTFKDTSPWIPCYSYKANNYDDRWPYGSELAQLNIFYVHALCVFVSLGIISYGCRFVRHCATKQTSISLTKFQSAKLYRQSI